MNYYIDEHIPEEGKYNAISKARQDVHAMLDAKGFKRIHIPTKTYNIDEEGKNSLSIRLNQGIFIYKNFSIWNRNLNEIKRGDTQDV